MLPYVSLRGILYFFLTSLVPQYLKCTSPSHLTSPLHLSFKLKNPPFLIFFYWLYKTWKITMILNSSILWRDCSLQLRNSATMLRKQDLKFWIPIGLFVLTRTTKGILLRGRAFSFLSACVIKIFHSHFSKFTLQNQL